MTATGAQTADPGRPAPRVAALPDAGVTVAAAATVELSSLQRAEQNHKVWTLRNTTNCYHHRSATEGEEVVFHLVTSLILYFYSPT